MSVTAPPPGKTPIARSLPPLLPTTAQQANARAGAYASPATTAPSPKSKAKMSPRGTGQVGRPPGPSKSAINSVKMQPPTANSPPARLPGPPTLVAPAPAPGAPPAVGVPAAPTGVAPALGPPVLQSSSPLPASTPPHSQPPTLQPMMVPVSSAATPAAMPGSLTTSQTNGQLKSANAQGMNRASPAAQPVSQAGVTAVKTTPILPKGQLTSKALPDATSADKADMAVEGTPKAVVKPNVLTHVIDGHVIQESSQPFPLDDTTKGRLMLFYHFLIL